MKLGLCIPLVAPYAAPQYIRTLGVTAESAGFSSLWVGEHVVLFDEYESAYPLAEDGKMPGDIEDNVELEPFSTLAYLAAHTSRIRIGTGVCVLPQRNPVYTAKEAANVDWLSGGRLNLGIGVGWLAEEYGALGASFERRGARCTSYIEVLKRLWCDTVSEYEDEFYSLPACRFYPKPVQKPHPPIIVGGNSDAALRRAAELGQGWYALGLSPEQLAPRIEQLEALLARRNRPRDTVAVFASPYPHEYDREMIRQYKELGVDELVFLDFAPTVDELESLLNNLAGEYMEFVSSL